MNPVGWLPKLFFAVLIGGIEFPDPPLWHDLWVAANGVHAAAGLISASVGCRTTDVPAFGPVFVLMESS